MRFSLRTVMYSRNCHSLKSARRDVPSPASYWNPGPRYRPMPSCPRTVFVAPFGEVDSVESKRSLYSLNMEWMSIRTIPMTQKKRPSWTTGWNSLESLDLTLLKKTAKNHWPSSSCYTGQRSWFPLEKRLGFYSHHPSGEQSKLESSWLPLGEERHQSIWENRSLRAGRRRHPWLLRKHLSPSAS